MKNRKELQLKALVDSGYTYMGINKQLVKKERIKTKLAEISFEVFNADSTKNEKVIRIALLKVKINRYKKQIKVTVTDLNSTNMFLEHKALPVMH